MKKIHTLKIEEHWLRRLTNKEKTCEIRFNDRDFQTGDIIQFMFKWEYEDRPIEAEFRGDYFVDEVEWIITHVLHFPDGLKEGYVALSIRPIQ